MRVSICWNWVTSAPSNPSDGAFTALREVAEYLAGQTLAVDVETVNLAMHFPRFFGAFRAFIWAAVLMIV